MKMTVTMTGIESETNEAIYTLDEEHVAYGTADFTDDGPIYCVDYAATQEEFDRVVDAVDDESIEKAVEVYASTFNTRREYCEATTEWADDNGLRCQDVCQIMRECDGTTCKVCRGE